MADGNGNTPTRLETATILFAYALEIESMRPQNIFSSICASANNSYGSGRPAVNQNQLFFSPTFFIYICISLCVIQKQKEWELIYIFVEFRRCVYKLYHRKLFCEG